MKRGQTNKQAAIENIRNKLAILSHWKADGIPVRADGPTEYFPRTIRQFNGWDLSQNSRHIAERYLSIKKNANDTLRNYPSTLAEVQTAISSLITLDKRPPKNVERIAILKRSAAELKTYTKVLERELITHRLEKSDWNHELLLMQNKYESILNELHLAKAKSDKDLASAFQQVSELRKIISRENRLRVVKNGPDKN